VRNPTDAELEALWAEYLTRKAAHPPGTPGFQATQSWYQIESARLHGCPLTLLPDPPPTIAGRVPWLDPIPIENRQDAWQELSQGNVRIFLGKADSGAGLLLVWMNRRLLLKLGGYEQALLYAYIGCRDNWWDYPLAHLRLLFQLADRTKLRAAGDPLPGPGPFTLYRGVAGSQRVSRIRGYSWTTSLERAQWFAKRYADKVPDPQVYRIEVPERAVLAYTNKRHEQEFFVQVPTRLQPERVA
jgi:hypothetical protein